MKGTNIMSPVILLIVLVVIIAGYIILNKIVQHKWGYTRKRERELENMDDLDFKDKLKK